MGGAQREDRPSLPSPLTGGRYRIAVVCLGNICRSPIAGVVLRSKLDDAGLSCVEVVSAGTGDWHRGEPMDRRSATVLSDYPSGLVSGHRAQQVDPSWLTGADRSDLVLAMDGDNLRDLRDLGRVEDPGRLRLFRDFDPLGPGDVPDPYYGGASGFADVLAMVERTSDVLVEELRRLT